MEAKRRTVVLALLAFLSAVGAGDIAAQDYPSKPIRLIAPFAPAGTLDVLARAIGQRLTEAWGQPVVVENRPGAGGNIGTEVVARSPADGHTMLLISVGFTSNPALYRKLPFDPVKDFAPVSLAAATQNVVVVHPSVPARSVKELIQLAKSRPGQLNFASSGTGTSQHLAGELFKSMAGVQMQHIPYRGGPLALTALISGEVSLMFNNLFTALPHVEAGRLRALAVTSAQRSPAAPGIRTIAESGLPDYNVSTWYGLLVPAGTPKGIVAKLNAEVVRILNLPEMRARLGNVVELTPSTPDQFAAHIRQEMVKWAQVVRQSGARAD
ncbi:MAG: tripartite tricarboxylate transporter substrate binding protein [Betaproteobacteria bacterium]|nr:tripartite tricarboxylate transporter substrate binding protein [Betaproteobacteria bacterium]